MIRMIRIIFMCIIMIFVGITNVFANSTILWYVVINGEKISYSVDVSESIGTNEMIQFNNAVKIIAENGKYSNLIELESLINGTAKGDIQNFHIVDVIVDEK